jgi:hypothetical protein
VQLESFEQQFADAVETGRWSRRLLSARGHSRPDLIVARVAEVPGQLGGQVAHCTIAPPQPSPVGHGVSVPSHCGRDPRPRDLPVIADERDRNGQRVWDHDSACGGVRHP